MDYYTLTDSAIETEIGDRLRALRLRRNITQKALAEATGLSVTAIKGIEAGGGTLSTLIAVLRELQALDQLQHFIPEITVSPLQLARSKGKQRQRATGKRGKGDGDQEW